MLALVTGRLAPYLWAGVGGVLALLVGVLTIQHYRVQAARAEIAAKEAALATAISANASLLTSIERQDAWHARQLSALDATHKAARARSARTAQQIEVIRNAPRSDDGPVAPVLRSYIDSLRVPGPGSGPDAAGAPPPAP